MNEKPQNERGRAAPEGPGVAKRLAAVLRGRGLAGGARLVDLGGQMVRPVRARQAVEELPPLCAARAHAIRESLRWGEAYIFFLAPDLIAWMVAVVHEGVLRGGVQGGPAGLIELGGDWRETMRMLRAAGASEPKVQRYLEGVQPLSEAAVKREADELFGRVMAALGGTPAALQRNRTVAEQQREIAEAIHTRKSQGPPRRGIREERTLLSLIRAGSRREARRHLNWLLGSLFAREPNLTIMRAQAIELLGYLVRTAIEDDPALDWLLEHNHQWMARMIEAADFEALAGVMRLALDDFMQRVFLQGYQGAAGPCGRVMTYLAAHFTEPVTLEEVGRAVGLSPSRVAHLVKEQTGQPVMQHVLRFRVERARVLLEESDRTVADIALSLGFCDQSHFTRQFRRVYGMTPARYRRQLRAPVA